MTVGSILAGTWDMIRREWRAVLVWGLVNFALSLAMRAAIGPVARAQAEGGAMPPWWSLAILYLLFVFGLVALYAAAFRAALLPGERHAAFLRAGMDELRVIGLAVLLYVGLTIAMVPLVLVATLVAVAFAATLGNETAPVVLLVAGSAILLLWIGVRLSIVFPLTVLRRRIVLKEAWRTTRGRFWTLLGAYLVLMLATGGVLLLLLLLLLPVTGPLPPLDATTPDAVRRLFDWQARQMDLWNQPAMILVQLLLAPVSGLLVAMVGGMPAVATAQMLAEQEDGHEF